MKMGTRAGRGWLWIAVVCGGLGVFEATQTVMVMRSLGMHHAWVALFFTVLLSWAPWAVGATFALRLGRKYPLFQKSSAAGWLQHAGLWALICVGSAAWNAGLEVLLNPYAPDMAPVGFWRLWQQKLGNQLLSSLVLYTSFLLLGWMLDSRERLALQKMETARLNEQLAKAQLSALRQQIEPHFLFNTLNTIAGLVREGKNDGAVDMIAGLSDLLRRTLQTSDKQQMELGEELEVVKQYLEIEKARFAERLRVDVDVPEELLRARVPSLILQPIVENAVKHGIAKRVQGGTIGISAARLNGTLTVRVKNDGPGFPVDWEHNGIGLENVRERLASLYGAEAELRVEDGTRGPCVAIAVPYSEGKSKLENRK
jgi:two-component system, LytTR family, sensor kinase